MNSDLLLCVYSNLIRKFIFTVYKRRHNWLEHILRDQMTQFQQNTSEVEQPARHSTLVAIRCHLNDKINKIRGKRTKMKSVNQMRLRLRKLYLCMNRSLLRRQHTFDPHSISHQTACTSFYISLVIHLAMILASSHYSLLLQYERKIK